MKRCTYCGKEYSNEATACPLDGRALVPLNGSPVKPQSAGAAGVVRVLGCTLLLWVLLFLSCFVGPLPQIYSQIAIVGIFIALPLGWIPGLLLGVLWELQVRKKSQVHDA
jgi:hypothetical protein